MCGTTARLQWNMPLTLTSITCRHLSTGYSHSVVFGPVMPALATSTSDPAQTLDRLAGCALDLVPLSDVDFDAGTLGAKRFGGGVQGILVKIPQAYRSAFGNQPGRHAEPDSGSTASNDSPTAAESIREAHCPSSHATKVCCCSPSFSIPRRTTSPGFKYCGWGFWPMPTPG